MTETHILTAAQEYVTRFFAENLSPNYVFHDLEHTQTVVQVARKMGQMNALTIREVELLMLAAWFHDTGYVEGAEGHEERSCGLVEKFLQQYQYPAADLELIKACIRATKAPQSPDGLLSQILCDADLSHLGEKSYWDRCYKLRQEMGLTNGKIFSENEWVDFELQFMVNHKYHTATARELFDERKFKHIVQLRKQKLRLNADSEQGLNMDDLFIMEKQKESKQKEKWKILAEQSEQEAKQLRIGRGVETMYRTTYNTHNNLSALADHKANLMLSINTIVISITLSALVPKLRESPQLIFPTVVLLAVCLTAIVFATLSTRPKVTQGEVTLDDIRQKRSNLLFFGNFHNMKLDDFQWGMIEMIKDTDFQYSSMTRDLYFLGKVLAIKYRYLTYCYNIFMYGLIVSVILFAIAFVTGGHVI